MSAKFTVTADRLSTADKDGNRTRYYRGDTISGLPDADVDRFIRAGAIAKPSEPVAKDAEEHPAEVPHGESSWPEESDALPPASAIVAERNSSPVAVAVDRPPNAATKERWVEYAVESGQLSEDEAKALTRDQLRDRVG